MHNSTETEVPFHVCTGFLSDKKHFQPILPINHVPNEAQNPASPSPSNFTLRSLVPNSEKISVT